MSPPSALRPGAPGLLCPDLFVCVQIFLKRQPIKFFGLAFEPGGNSQQ